MCVCVPSGEVIVEDSGVPVQEDWSMAPDEDKVKFSLSGVTPLCGNSQERRVRQAEQMVLWTHTHTHRYVESQVF